MEIRRATSADAGAISALILGMADKLTVHPDGRGAEEFLTTLSPAAIDGYIRAANCRYWTGTIDGALAGLVAVRDNTHLFHLFVAPAFQGCGLSARLWRHARDEARAQGDVAAFTVNASISAAPIYRHFGFQDTSAVVEMNGLAFIPMRMAV